MNATHSGVGVKFAGCRLLVTASYFLRLFRHQFSGCCVESFYIRITRAISSWESRPIDSEVMVVLKIEIPKRLFLFLGILAVGVIGTVLYGLWGYQSGVEMHHMVIGARMCVISSDDLGMIYALRYGFDGCLVGILAPLGLIFGDIIFVNVRKLINGRFA